MSKSTNPVGIDEAGRGALAGPVVAAAVILNSPIPGLNDSKQLTALKREALYHQLLESDAEIRIALKGPKTIDTLNILWATMAAMKCCINRLQTEPSEILIDGNRAPVLGTSVPIKTIIKGDAKIPCISAASIVAKVVRDKIMTKYASRYPAFSFDVHKGYGTRKHYEELDKNGPCPMHRRSFRLSTLNQEALLTLPNFLEAPHQ